MASVLALISKSVFDKLPIWDTGQVAALDRYTSKHAAFDKLGEGDALFLVTVRPKGLWLLAIVEDAKRKGDSLVGRPNTRPVTDITAKLPKIQLADGKGIKAKLDKLGMSLQTPRVLADADVSLLRGATPRTGEALDVPAKQLKMSIEKRPKKSDEPKLVGGKLSARAQQLLAEVYKSPNDRGLKTVLADQLLEDHHVWGELISLQMASPSKHAERIKQITHQHAREMVGDIAEVASRYDMKFEDGFLVEVRCGKSKSFTKASNRMKAAAAPQWATVHTVIFTYDMPGTFRAALLQNPASSNLTKIRFDSYRGNITLLERAKPSDPWTIKDADCETELAGLPIEELRRIAIPAKPAARDVLAKVLAKREKAPAKAKQQKKKR